MSNNRNRNRNRNSGQRAQGEQVARGPEDKPFIYNGKNGRIVIPAGTEFDPDADVFIDIDEAQKSKNDVLASAAMLRMIKSGFPDEISKTIRLKASELQDFTNRYMQFTGANIPK